MVAQNQTDQMQAWVHYLTTEEGLSPATVKEYLKDLRLLRTWLDRPELPEAQRVREWSQISAADLRTYLAHSKPAPRRNHRLVSSWRSFWVFLRDIQRVPDLQLGPAELRRPKLPRRLPGALELTDVARLLDAVWNDRSPARGERNWCIVAFLYGTGLRISEMLDLKFDQIEVQDGQPIAVRVIGKGDKERRVPLSETARSALTRWLRLRRMHGNPVSPWVWSPLSVKRSGQQMQRRSIGAMLDAAARRAGLDVAKVSPHKLRHTFATALIESGRTLDEIRVLLGHESIQTTTIYAHTSNARVAAAAAALPDVVGLSVPGHRPAAR
ncbi:tyrosine-type recombinase/integrase [Deinococcus marmoris]|uniref:tyrosine-type recombinase/integrase n=1 Tax=Deinococcus marmoris TaxID=249408 RepID=UPI000689217E|nr:tyrosine-type recombinase/integrase [Deinococcus marmoris]